MFVLCSEITIGKFRFSGVNQVQISRSIHDIEEKAIIKLPSIARIETDGKVQPAKVITGQQFSEGDPVTIKLGYNSDLRTEFRGFVKHQNLDMPMEIVCEGYSWLLRRLSIFGFWESITVKRLLEIAVSHLENGASISVLCDVPITLYNVKVNQASGFDIINNILKNTDRCLSCFFIRPDVLWCGLIYTPYANGNKVFDLGTVNYRLGYNTLKGNSLKLRSIKNEKAEVHYHKKLPDGRILTAVSDVFLTHTISRSKILNHISEQSYLKQLADEKAFQVGYDGYEGSLTAFLQPFAEPGYEAFITDDRFPERNGTYLIESVEVSYGIKGARRILDIGPRFGFSNNAQ